MPPCLPALYGADWHGADRGAVLRYVSGAGAAGMMQRMPGLCQLAAWTLQDVVPKGRLGPTTLRAACAPGAAQAAMALAARSAALYRPL